MIKLIEQEKPNECSIACLAMATRRAYKEILDSLSSEAKECLGRGEGIWLRNDIEVLEFFGFDWEGGYPKEGFVPVPKQAAILMVPSKNKEEAKHAVFWDGSNVLDPSKKNKYTTQEALDCCEYVNNITKEKAEKQC